MKKAFWGFLLAGIISFSSPLLAATPVAGKDYQIVAQNSSAPTDNKTIEVLEFFWYGCPHCYDLEPVIEPWIAKQKKDVVIRRVPVAFKKDYLIHSQLYYTLEAMGKLSTLHEQAFRAFHANPRAFMTEEGIADWAANKGLDRAKFLSLFRSFGIMTKAETANKEMAKYRLEGVPGLVVQEKYVTSPSIVGGSQVRTLEVLDWLIEQIRHKKL